MTPEQVARAKARSYALLGAGIAVFVAAFQYATSTPSEGVRSVNFAILLVAIGIVFLIIAGLTWRKVRKQNVPAAAPTDLSGPQGKIVIVLIVLGFIALAGSYFVDDLVPNDEILGMLLSVGLLVIVIVCFVIAARIARKIRSHASTIGAAKE